MAKRLVALILLCTAFLIQTAEIPQQISLTVAEVGDNLTLTCPVSGDEVGLFYWYKLNFGYMVQTVAEGSFDKITLKRQFNKSKLTVAKSNTQYFLHIRNVSKEDEATYFCQAGSAYEMSFVNGTLLAVNDHRKRQKYFYVKQSPEMESVQSGESVTLQCSLLPKKKENTDQCPAVHSVYWLYRGAAVQCGEILFCERTERETEQEWDPVILVLGILLALCVIVIAILICSRDQK
ncbi:uncharacterized protein LOC122990657 [Thunnus albacares]|uniref:uncharacterized protein LOC122990657 n=1 Tax=Thunnus albacares TaxID=8236 RepID=UPI001CF6D449|nr:uncharacterized protein LOC122990657 [Thunnus albacares]